VSRIKTRTQIKTEFLKDAKFRIYFLHQDAEIYEKLKMMIESHKTYYSVSLGLSENLANFNYIGEYSFSTINNNDWIDIQTVLKIDNFLSKGDIDFTEEGKEYFTDKVALEMKSDREVLEYGQLVYERNGQSIKARPKMFYELGNGDKCFLF